jgi:hypothetical protein
METLSPRVISLTLNKSGTELFDVAGEFEVRKRKSNSKGFAQPLHKRLEPQG